MDSNCPNGVLFLGENKLNDEYHRNTPKLLFYLQKKTLAFLRRNSNGTHFRACV